METVIPPNKTSGHVIQKYHFKVLAEGPKNEDGHLHEEVLEESTGEEEQTVSSDQPQPVERRDEVVEQMLKKADELSTNLVKMQMQLEKQQQEFEKRIEEEKAAAFEAGKEAGTKECMEQVESALEEQRRRLATAVEALEQSREMFLRKVDTIEEELIETALDLAKQVVAKEVQSDSKEVALRLARLLLAEVKDAAKITLKVNPDDYDYLKANLAESGSGVEITADPAVGAGGVIIQSDIGNIDGEIMHRFERIKEAVFGTVNQGNG
ncbi:flagellar assembly protein FliH [Hydrogenimonas sp.]|nr:flagellar assembly protein FliH [Hydrogenimonas sp.]